jgi:tRNA A37 threonylcarbamoyladenosine dehydratase
VDCGLVKLSNCSQQLCALDSTVGQYKADVMSARLRDVNPGAPIIGFRWKISADAAADLLRLGAECVREWGERQDAKPCQFDAVVDCCDDIHSKASLAAAAVAAGAKVVVLTAGAATRLDPSLMTVADISQTSKCPVARKLRGMLKAAGVARGVRVVFSSEPPRNRFMTSKDGLVDQFARRPGAGPDVGEDGRAKQEQGQQEQQGQGTGTGTGTGFDDMKDESGAEKREGEKGGERRWQPSPMGSWVVVPAMFGLQAAHEVVMSLAPAKPPPEGFAAAFYQAEAEPRHRK